MTGKARFRGMKKSISAAARLMPLGGMSWSCLSKLCLLPILGQGVSSEWEGLDLDPISQGSDKLTKWHENVYAKMPRSSVEKWRVSTGDGSVLALL